MKRKLLTLIVITVLLFTACGGGVRKLSDEDKKLMKNYIVWTDAIDIFSDDSFSIVAFDEVDNKIKVTYAETPSAKDTDFLKLITVHNKYIDDNPKYFFNNQEFYFEIETDSASGYYYTLGSSLDAGYFEVPDEASFELEDRGHLDYLIYSIGSGCFEKVAEKYTTADVKVLVLDRADNVITDQDYFDISYLKFFKGLKYFVINIDGTVEDYSLLANRVVEENPDVVVYIISDGKVLNH